MKRVCLIAVGMLAGALSVSQAGPNRNELARLSRDELLAPGAVRPLERPKFSHQIETSRDNSGGANDAALPEERGRRDRKSLVGKLVFHFEAGKQTISVQPLVGNVNGAQLSMTW